MQGCSECIGCAGLRKEKFCIFNKQCSEREYREKKAELELCHPHIRALLRERLQELSLGIPHRFMQSAQAEHVSGNYVYQSKNVHDSFYADRSKDCRYCAQVVDLKDCHDNNYTEENELCYDYLGAYQVTRVSFSKFCNKVSDSLYCDECHQNCSHLFGCIGLKGKQYRILNKQYTREEYEKLMPRIIEHMRERGEWGEFFPIELSPYGYNETVAQEYFPLEREQARKRGYRWYDDERQEKYLGPEMIPPDNIDDVEDDICEKILICSVTGRPYKIIPQELRFYRKMKLPIPRKCPDERHRERLVLRNPRKLWNRSCQQCTAPIKTSYAPHRPEIVYCERCYLQVIY
jgi:hypothetical protein